MVLREVDALAIGGKCASCSPRSQAMSPRMRRVSPSAHESPSSRWRRNASSTWDRAVSVTPGERDLGHIGLDHAHQLGAGGGRMFGLQVERQRLFHPVIARSNHPDACGPGSTPAMPLLHSAYPPQFLRLQRPGLEQDRRVGVTLKASQPTSGAKGAQANPDGADSPRPKLRSSNCRPSRYRPRAAQ